MPSTVIKSHHYLPDKETLIITFTSGKIYAYSGVNGDTYDGLRKAFSKGIYFNKYIKPYYPFKELNV